MFFLNHNNLKSKTPVKIFSFSNQNIFKSEASFVHWGRPWDVVESPRKSQQVDLELRFSFQTKIFEIKNYVHPMMKTVGCGFHTKIFEIKSSGPNPVLVWTWLTLMMGVAVFCATANGLINFLAENEWETIHAWTTVSPYHPHVWHLMEVEHWM